MEELIKALQIFLKYKNERRPVHFDLNTLNIVGISFDEVSEEDVKELSKLTFFWDDTRHHWSSCRYGHK